MNSDSLICGILWDGAYPLPLHDDRLGEWVIAAFLVGETLQIIQLHLQLDNQLLLLFSLSLQALPLFPLALSHTHTQAEKWQCVKSMLYTHTQNLVKGCISQSRFVNTHQLLLSRKHERKEWGRKAKQLSIKLHVKDQIFMYTKDRNGNLRARKGQNVVLLWLKLNFWTFVWSYTRFRCLLGLGRNVL